MLRMAAFTFFKEAGEHSSNWCCKTPNSCNMSCALSTVRATRPKVIASCAEIIAFALLEVPKFIGRKVASEVQISMSQASRKAKPKPPMQPLHRPMTGTSRDNKLSSKRLG